MGSYPVNTSWNDSLWRQFGAAIDMLENAITACPEELWSDRERRPEVWHLAYHTLFFLDLYLSPSTDGFAPPPPFALDELDPDAVIPERPYTKDEVLAYLEHGRRKCRAAIEALTEDDLHRPSGFDWVPVPRAELHLYNLRHVQHGAAQLNLLLRQTIGAAPGWVKRTE
jgi:hypothetical protein